MRSLLLGVTALLLSAGAVAAQTPPAGAPAGVPGGAPGEAGDGKVNANPCRDEVAAALKKLRATSWFRMTTTMITETGPVAMEIDYVLPDRMHQKVTQKLANTSSEIILVGDKAWGTDGKGWAPLSGELTHQLKSQLYENVIEEQKDVGNYACKGRAQFEGRDALSYKLVDEPDKDSTAPKNITFRMFYVDALTGMPLGNALLVPGREQSPLFKATYAYPIDMKIEPPKDVMPAAPASTPASTPASGATPAPASAPAAPAAAPGSDAVKEPGK